MSEWAISFRRRGEEKAKAVYTRLPGSDRTVNPKLGWLRHSARDVHENGAIWESGLQDSPEPYK